MAGKNICLVMQGGMYWRGGMEYITNLLTALHSFRESAQYSFNIFVLTTKNIEAEAHAHLQSVADKVFYEEAELPGLNFLNRAVWFLRRTALRDPFPRWRSFIARNHIDVIYPGCAARPDPYKPLTIGWIYDFQHKYLPQFFEPSEIRKREEGFVNIARNTSLIVVSSTMAQRDLAEFLPWASPKSRVLSFRSSCQDSWYAQDPCEVQKRCHLPDRFFLVSNQFWQHKNHLVIFDALKILAEKDVHPAVVCTGPLHDYRAPTYSDRILQSVISNGLHCQVYLLGLIPKADQIALMRRSIAVVQPSLFEGWSTLVENARALGKRLILSDIPVHVEQNPPYSIFFKHEDPKDLADRMLTVWNSGSPGPDMQKEEKAKADNARMMVEFGGQFMSIVNGAPGSSGNNQRGAEIMKRIIRRVWGAFGIIANKFPFRVQCNVCGWKGRRLFSDSWHPYTICPRCKSQVRHRLFFAALQKIPDLKAERLVQGKRVLHFAPEQSISEFLAAKAEKYMSADLYTGGVDMRLDISNMHEVSDGSFDLVVACDLLEHVPDDSAALREIRRILPENGWVILTVPQKDNLPVRYEDPSITAPEARKKAFGQEDHLRIYGDDFGRFLESQGFSVTTIDEHSFDPETARKNVLYPPILSTHPLATNHRKVYFGQKRNASTHDQDSRS